jgi:hypothetical protein
MRYLVGLVCVLALGVMPLVGCGDGGSGVCDSFCAKDAECWSVMDQIPRCTQWCQYSLDVSGDTSAECEAAATDVFSCVADLSSCEEVEAYWYEEPFDNYPCKAADDNVESTCF